MKDIRLTDSEVSSLIEFIECYFVDSIRKDDDVDSLLYIYNITNFYRKIGGFDQFSDYKGDE